MRLESYDKSKGRRVLVGELENGVLRKRVMPEIHRFKKFDAYGIQKDALDAALAAGCKRVEIIEPKNTWSSDILDWFGVDIKVMDYGSGPQAFLPLNRMELA